MSSCVSPLVTVTYGVTQGTVLGPSLFLCYSADLTNTVKYSTISMFADDTKLYKGIHTVSSGLLFRLIGQFTHVLELYDPFGVDVPLNSDITHCAGLLSGHNKQLSILYCRTEKRKLFWSNIIL